jgi:Tfp pilus assembly protein PilF
MRVPQPGRTPKKAGFTAPSGHWGWVGPLLIVVVAAIAYANSFHGVFVYDDPPSIVDNPPLRTLWPTWPELWAKKDTTFAGRPVAAFTFALNYAISGFDAWSYHLFNLAIHVLCGLTLLGLLRRTMAGETPTPPGRGADATGPLRPTRTSAATGRPVQSPAATGRPTRGSAATGGAGAALAVTLLWVVHPLQTESVTYISTRTESLMSLFLLLTLYCVLRGAASGRGRLWSILAVACCALGMGSKEVMVVAPLLVLLYDRTFLAGSFAVALRQRVWLYVGLAATWLILAGLLALQPRAKSVGFHHADIKWWEYALTQFGVLVYYLRLSVWPHPLIFCYDSWSVARALGTVWPQAVLITTLAAGTLWALWRRPWLGFLGAWFFLILAPSSSIVPIVTEVAAERRMYLPLAAVILLGALGAARWLLRGRPRWIGAGLVVLLVAVCAGATSRRNLVYSGVETAWRDVLRTYPDSPGAHLSLATEFYQHDRTDEGIAILEALLKRDPGVWEAHYGLGHGYRRKDNLPLAAEHYGLAVRIDPNDCRARTNYGGLLLILGKPAEAETQLVESLRIKPDQPFALFHLGRTYETERRLDDAAQVYRRWLELDPNTAMAHARLGIVLAAQGRTADATQHLEQALRLQSDLTEAQDALARLRGQ